MRRKDFSYELPEELIAQAPLSERSASRMLVLDGVSGALTDSAVRELPRFLEPGDLLVFNDTRVVAARLVGVKPSGGRVEILLERALAGPGALAQLSASKPIRAGLEVHTAGGIVRVLAREDELWRIALPAPALPFFERFGAVPLPPYIRRAPDALDRERYQSLFAREPGAVAAPTASLHFDEPLLEALRERGVHCAWITLHVGAGTFQPLRTDDIASHTMHAERASVSAATVDAIARTRAAGGRVVAVGTTVMRALESAALPAGGGTAGARAAAPGEGGAVSPLAPWSGDTRLYITPGFHFRVSDVLLTNFHLPESTLLILVCAFAGRHRTLAAYEHAVRARYRFFSYGDAMLITRGSA
ncbi:MAG: tRNA preQ1(34) S-adenosylmethionine ribosyltransferase-isomerase QueA [Gammaproteobacteria bacterium]|nr:MAG: tRNA preQ1(34) S-adenosylmethionine ribosyltransferase-isomerase QueA [Gammaproteobacteria bacterium]